MASAPVLPRIRGISFDYGHVLGGLDLDELARRIVTLSNTSVSFGASVAAVDIARLRTAMPAAYSAHDEAIARGLHHEGGWRALVATLVRAGLPDDRDVKPYVDAIWDAQPTRNLWRNVPPEARAMLDRLRDANVPMVITSNSEGRIAELLAEVEIRDRFVAVLDSGLLGYGKPDRRIFDDAVRALDLPRECVVHVGDSEAADIVGAREAGLQAVRFDGFVPGASAKPTVAAGRFDTHAELTEALLAALRTT